MLTGSTDETTELSLDRLTFMAMLIGASDIHLTPGMKPRFRLNGDLIDLSQSANLLNRNDGKGGASKDVLREVLEQSRSLDTVCAADTRDFLKILPAQLKETYDKKGSCCISAASTPTVENTVRLRIHYMKSREKDNIVIRLIPVAIPEPGDLNIPRHVREFAHKSKDLIIICGTQGQGKSTTLASLVEEINGAYNKHIVTIEDPIEFMHTNRDCTITQREIGTDSPSFAQALEDVHREDANVVVVGEVRSEKEMDTVLTLAEAGLLVFATLHSRGAAEALERVIHMFSDHERARYRLSSVISGVACQQLLKRKDGAGRILATEILTATETLRNIIRTNEFKNIDNEFISNKKHGNTKMSEAYEELKQRDLID